MPLLTPYWSRTDIAQAGLPRVTIDDMPAIRSELADGAGFVIVDGLKASEQPAAFIAFGEALGDVLPQNRKLETLVEIADFSDEDAFDDRGYRSPGELTPHTDPPPMIALHCVRGAMRGGTSTIVNGQRLRDQICERDADAFAILSQGLAYFLPDENKQGEGSLSEPIPVFAGTDSELSCVYYRPFIERGFEAMGSPPDQLTVAALDLLDELAAESENKITFDLMPGETVVLNNYRVMHARDDFQDWPDKARRRLLLRLWLDAVWLPEPPPAHAFRKSIRERMVRP